MCLGPSTNVDGVEGGTAECQALSQKQAFSVRQDGSAAILKVVRGRHWEGREEKFQHMLSSRNSLGHTLGRKAVPVGESGQYSLADKDIVQCLWWVFSG